MSTAQEEFDCSVCGLTVPHEHTELIWDDVWGLVTGPNDKVVRSE